MRVSNFQSRKTRAYEKTLHILCAARHSATARLRAVVPRVPPGQQGKFETLISQKLSSSIIKTRRNLVFVLLLYALFVSSTSAEGVKSPNPPDEST